MPSIRDGFYSSAARATKRVDPDRMRSVIGIAKDELSGRSALEWLDEDKTAFDLATRAGHIELAQLINDRGGKRAVDLRSSR